jgi:hypothetical protein
MTIGIYYPLSGSQENPVRLSRRFVAFGSKDPGEVATGVMLSVDRHGRPDNKCRVGGQTLLFAPRSDGTSAKPNRWAIYFCMPPTVKQGQRFTLAVFDSANVPTSIANQPTLPKSEFLRIRKGAQTNVEIAPPPREAVSGSPSMAIAALAMAPEIGSASRENFYAFGALPNDCNDIDTLQTELVDVNNSDNKFNPYYAWPDSNGVWVAFFPPITDTAITKVTLTVVFAPTGEEQEVSNISLV